MVELDLVSAYIAPAMKRFHPSEWCFDPYAKQCERCDTLVGRFAVMTDERGLRQVVFWPQSEWGGIEGGYRCRAHTGIAKRWLRLG